MSRGYLCAWCRSEVGGAGLTCSAACRSQLSRARRSFRQVMAGEPPDRPVPAWFLRAVGAELTRQALRQADELGEAGPRLELFGLLLAGRCSRAAADEAVELLGQVAERDLGVQLAVRAALRWAHLVRTGRPHPGRTGAWS